MRAYIALISLSAASLLVASCSGDERAPKEEPLTLHEVMKDEIDANADKLWDLTNEALDDEAQIDPDRMSEAQWAELALLAGKVKEGANKISAMDTVVVVKPGVKIADEDVPYGDSAAQVQANIDKDPELLRQFADALATHMTELVSAANDRDAARASPIVDQLDGVCENCHVEFWYPSQKELIEKYRSANAAPAS